MRYGLDAPIYEYKDLIVLYLCTSLQLLNFELYRDIKEAERFVLLGVVQIIYFLKS